MEPRLCISNEVSDEASLLICQLHFEQQTLKCTDRLQDLTLRKELRQLSLLC